MTTGIYELTDTWGDGGTVFKSIEMTITDTAYAAGSMIIDLTTTVAGGYFRVDPDGNLDFSGTLANTTLAGYLDYTPIAAPAHFEGRVFYDSAEKALSYYNDATDVTINIGQESVIRVVNNSGGDIDDGVAVYISGATGGLPEIEKAIATAGDTQVIGATTNDILDGQTGYVTTFGVIRGLDTSGFLAGDLLYLSDSVAGEITNVPPLYPLRQVQMGNCITSDAGAGKIFIDIDQNNALIAVVKSYTFAARSAASGIYYQAGFYDAPAADANLTQASTTVVYGTANVAYAAHAFIVSAGDGATDGSDLVLTVTGTSVTDAGVRTPADTQVVCADCLAGATPVDTYLETSKKWIGQITYTLSSTGGTAFAFSFNYGVAKYEDYGNVDVTLRGIECVGNASATDTGFDIELLHHNDIGWTYSAAAFVAGNTPIESMSGTHGVENDISNGLPFAFKRTEVEQAIAGSASEGLVVRVTTTTANTVAYMDTHLTATIP